MWYQILKSRCRPHTKGLTVIETLILPQIPAKAKTNMSSRRPRQEDSDEEMEVGEIQPSQSAELAYDPDQRPEEKRRVRAQYRQLLGEQNGALDRVLRV